MKPDERVGGREPLVISIDHRSPAAHVHLLTWLTWPHDEERRCAALAAHRALQRATLERERAARIEEEAVKAVRAATGGREATPEGKAMVADVKADLMAHARETIDRELLVPAGGMEMADRHPGWPAECEVGAEAFRRRMFVGQMLVLVRTLDAHHGGDPRLAPSLRRALAIMQGETKAGRYDAPSTKTLLEWWAEARSIAPLCAATFLMWRRQGPQPNDPAALLATVAGMATVLGTAKGLREWATGFKHPLAPSALIPEDGAAVYDADVPAREPRLQPLDDVQRKAARDYRAA